MKGIFKLTAAALALVTFASCSNDELFGEKQSAPQPGEGILVEVEDLLDPATTRTAYTPDGKVATLNWENGDELKVTDGTMLKYDVYSFNGKAFAFDAVATDRNTTWISEPEFAATNTNNTKLSIDNAKKESIAKVTIWENQNWYETNDGFHSNLPLWGTAESDDTYGVKLSMKYLTGVLKMDINNVPGNAEYIVVQGWQNLAGTKIAPMTGTFKAVLATDGEVNENAQLEVVDGNTYKNTLKVYVGNATKASSMVLIPLVAQKYERLDIYYAKDYTDLENENWTLITSKEGLNVERRKFYNLTYSSFDVAGEYPSDITAILKEKKNESKFEVKTSNTTKVFKSSWSSYSDTTIELPESSADITLNLTGVKAEGSDILNIEGEQFTGKLTINIKGNEGIDNLFINLPYADVTVLGDAMSTMDLGQAGTYPDNTAGGLIAKTLTLGKATFKDVYANAELGYKNTNANDPDLMLVNGSTVKSINFETNYKADLIEINGTLTNDLDLTKWTTKNGSKIVSAVKIGNGAKVETLTTYGDVTVTGGTVTTINTDGNVSVSGVTNAQAGTKAGDVTTIQALSNLDKNHAATKNITLSEEATVKTISPKGDFNKYALSMSGKSSVTTSAEVESLNIAGTDAFVQAATVDKDATIANTNESEAVNGTLTMTAGNTLNLTGGYVNEISVTAVTNKSLTIKYPETEAFIAINTISGSGAWTISGTSVWNGKAIGGGRNAQTEATLISALKAKYVTDATKIFTAMQLASLTGTFSKELQANIDLNGKAWTSPALNATTFTGKNLGTPQAPLYPTISNLNLAADANKWNGGVNGVGLFSTAATGATISNLTVKNVTSSITEADGKQVTEIGTLVGKANGALEVNNVSIVNANVGATIADKVGGIVGNAAGDITLTKATVIGLTLNGNFYIGGVVGMTSNKVNVSDKTSIDVTAINVPASFNAEPDIKTLATEAPGYGSVGMIIGQGATDAITDNDKLTVNDKITGHRQALGYKMYYKDAGPNVKYYYGKTSNGHDTKNVWIGRQAAISAKEITKQAEFDATWKEQPIVLVKHDIYDANDK